MKMIKEYLVKNSKVDVICAQAHYANESLRLLTNKAKTAGKDVYLASFVVNTVILKAIKDGKVVAAGDQQLYRQRFLPLMDLCLTKHKVHPIDIVVTSPVILEGKNVDSAMEGVIAGYR
jgi:ABC-type sugar transport system substrate-binding protein